VGGKVAKQQTTGPLQLPLNNCGVMADYNGKEGVATSIGHSPVAALLILLQEVEPPLLRLYRILFGLQVA
jgi:hypothetical protein